MAITSAEQAFQKTGSPYGKTIQQLKNRAIDHLREWRPKEFKHLRTTGQLQQVTAQRAREASLEIDRLMQRGFQNHEAEEIVLPRFILLTPEK
jgi:hypothetical protein